MAEDLEVALRQRLADLYPGRWAALLIPVDGKRPLQRNWNKQALARYQGDFDRERHLSGLGRLVSNGSNVGLVLPPGVVALDVESRKTVQAARALSAAGPFQTSRSAHRGHVLLRIRGGRPVPGWAKVAGEAVLVRTPGSQIVCEPSLHPETERMYQWVVPLPSRPELVPLFKGQLKAATQAGERRRSTSIEMQGGLEEGRELLKKARMGEARLDCPRHPVLLALAVESVQQGKNASEVSAALKRFDLQYFATPVQEERPREAPAEIEKLSNWAIEKFGRVRRRRLRRPRRRGRRA